ncbi:MAG TPA: PhaM family polyhydroxyalkanoate granule multifunctional regulatory protein [Burkholderiales bacterium]|nr:PhaM family polyhydroxyalkanoate granule multifunctional regulatory protein [Burkholderiales bacterium]
MSQGSDPFEFIKNFWSNVPGMGAMAGAGGATAMPSFDPQDLEKRVGELKQVKQWLEMNLNMLNLQINTLEMQLTAVNSFENYTHNATHNARSSAANDSAPPDMSQANEAAGAAAKAASEAGASAIAQGAQALQSMPWANPGDWIKSMQAAFGSGMPVVKTRAKAKGAAPAKSKSRSSARPSAARPAASRAAKPKRSRKTP